MTPDEMTGDDLKKIGADWLQKIKDAEKREESWRRDAEFAEDVFAARGSEDARPAYDFNILYSNVETLTPAIFNTSPKPDVRESFSTGPVDPMAATYREVAQVLERAILQQLDDDRLTVEMTAAVQDTQVSGRGVVRVRFDADEVEIPPEPMAEEYGEPMGGDEEADETDEVYAEEAAPMQPQIIMRNERVTYEVVAWRDYRQGPSSRHMDTPWRAYRHMLPKEEIERIRDEDLKQKLMAAGEFKEETKESHVWEIWCKATKRVYFITAATEVLRIVDDPLGLSGFFPSCEPIQPISLTGRTEPICPFAMYRKLADELDDTTRRINAIISGMKVRGLIAGTVDDLQALAEADDNTLIPVANLEGLAATGGIANAIQWWPVEQAAKVLQQLYLARDATKEIIYEVTGIGDVVRGATDPNETLGAQQIKSQWVSLRIKRLQDDVARAARELMTMTAEIIGTKFSPETLQRMTGVQITPQALDVLSRPLDFYKINIETDSTIRSDLSRVKGEMGEFLGATGNYFNTMAPVVAQAPAVAGPIVELYAAFARQFNLGKQAEDALEAMVAAAKQQAAQPPKPPQPTPVEAAKIETDKAKTQIEAGHLKVAQDKTKLEAAKLVADAARPQVVRM